MNLQVIASPDGEVFWASGPLPGAVHDLTAARIWASLRELAAAGLTVLADKGYHGAGDHIRTPYKGRNKPPSRKTANRAAPNYPVQAKAPMPSFKHLAHPAQTPLLLWRAGQLTKAIHVLQTREIEG